MKRKPRMPILVCTESFDRFGLKEKRTSAWLATQRVKLDGMVTWDPGRKAIVPRQALSTWLGLMRFDASSERDLMFVGLMEACVDQLVYEPEEE